jgi:c(7)-type cytochrome triheme protein
MTEPIMRTILFAGLILLNAGQSILAADAPKPAPAAIQAGTVAAVKTGAGEVNAFNRLHKPPKRNLPPAEDGIHDAENEATHSLQTPHEAFQALPRNNAGNRVNWVGSILEKKIQPRANKDDPKVEPVLMDLDIVREVKGSMPDVVYPHQAHTEWLDCSNCHPAIFVPEKGANNMSMAAILLGQQCGTCHGKVAFPVSECRLCHSKAKEVAKAGAK